MNTFQIALESYSEAMRMAQEATEATGVAVKNQDIYNESYTAKITNASNAVKELQYDLLNSDSTKGMIEGFTSVISVLDTLIDKFGSIGKLITGGAFITALKGLGTILGINAIQRPFNFLTSAVKSMGTFVSLLNKIPKLYDPSLLSRISSASAATWGISFLPQLAAGIAAVAVAYKAYDLATVSAAEAQETYNESVGKYESTKSELENVNSELETTKERISELLTKGSLSFVEQSELLTLKETNDQLERKQKLLEKLAETERQQMIIDAQKAYEKSYGSYDSYSMQNGQSLSEQLIEEAYQEYLDSNETSIYSVAENDPMNYQIAAYRYMKHLQDLYPEEDYSESILEQLGILESELVTLNGIRDKLGDRSKLTAAQQSFYDELTNSISFLWKELDPTGWIELLFSEQTWTTARNALLNKAKDEQKPISLDYVKQAYADLINSNNVDDTYLESWISDINSELGLLNYDEIKSQIRKKFQESLSDSDMDKGILDEFNSWIGSLSEEDLEIVYKIRGEEDASSYTLQDWISRFYELKDAAESATESTLSAFYSVVTDSSSQIESYTKKVSALSSAQTELSSSGSLSADTIKSLAEAGLSSLQIIDGMAKGFNSLINSSGADFKTWAEEAGSALEGADASAWQEYIDSIIEANNKGISSFEEWNTAVSSANQGANYDTIQGKLKDMKSLWDNGKIGTDDWKTFAKMINQYGIASVDQFLSDYEKAARYITEDKTGLVNFLNDLSSKGLASKDASGNWEITADSFNDMANALGTSETVVQEVYGKLEEYGALVFSAKTVDEAKLNINDIKNELTTARADLAILEAKGADDSLIKSQKEYVGQLAQDYKRAKEMVKEVQDDNIRMVLTLDKAKKNITDEDVLAEINQQQLEYADAAGMTVEQAMSIDVTSVEVKGIKESLKESLESDTELQDDINTILNSGLSADELGLIQLSNGSYDIDNHAVEDALLSIADKFGYTTEEVQALIEAIMTLNETDVEEKEVTFTENDTPETITQAGKDYWESLHSGDTEKTEAQINADNIVNAIDGSSEKISSPIVTAISSAAEAIANAITGEDGGNTTKEEGTGGESVEDGIGWIDYAINNKDKSKSAFDIVDIAKPPKTQSELEHSDNYNAVMNTKGNPYFAPKWNGLSDDKPFYKATINAENVLLETEETGDDGSLLSQLDNYNGSQEETEVGQTDRVIDKLFDYDSANVNADTVTVNGEQTQEELKASTENDPYKDKLTALGYSFNEDGTPISPYIENYADLFGNGEIFDYQGLYDYIYDNYIKGNETDYPQNENGDYTLGELEDTRLLDNFTDAVDNMTGAIEAQAADAGEYENVETAMMNVSAQSVNMDAKEPVEKGTQYLTERSQQLSSTSQTSSSTINEDQTSGLVNPIHGAATQVVSVEYEADDSLVQLTNAELESESVDINVEYNTEGAETPEIEPQEVSLPLQVVEGKVTWTAETGDVENYEPEDKDGTAIYGVNETAVLAYQPSDKSANVNFIPESSEVDSYLSTLDGLTKDIYVTIHKTTVSEGTTEATGTFASGTLSNAYADGRDITLGKDEDALVNEEGNESIVRAGKWSIIPGGAHVEHLRKGDIVFSKSQTKSLLEHGSISGHGRTIGMSAHANGTYSGMSAYPTGVNDRVNLNGNGSSTTSSSSSSSGSGSSGGSGTGSGSDNDSNNKETKSELEKWLEKLFDWIELKISRTADKIEKYASRAEKARDKGNYKAAARSYRAAMYETGQQIQNSAAGSVKYKGKAEEILQRGISDSTITAELAEEIRQRVADGTIEISEYEEEVRKVIEAYKEWYEKGYSLDQQIMTLSDNLTEYATSLANIPLEKAEAKIDKLSKKLEILNARIESLSGTSRTGKYANVTNSIINNLNAQDNANITADRTANRTYQKDKSRVTGLSAGKVGMKGNKTYEDIFKSVKSFVSKGKKVSTTVIGKIEDAIKDSASSPALVTALTNLLSAVTRWNASVDAKEAADTTASLSAITTENEKKAAYDAQRDNYINYTSGKSQVGQSTVATTAESQISQIESNTRSTRASDNAYSSATDYNENNLAATSIKAYGALTSKKKDPKEYKEAIKRARKQIQALKPIAQKDINIIRKYYPDVAARCEAYNTALQNLENARFEEAANYATNSAQREANKTSATEAVKSTNETQMNINEANAENATTAVNKNRILMQNVGLIDSNVEADRTLVNTFRQDEATSKNKMNSTMRSMGKLSGDVKATVLKAVDCANASKPIPTDIIEKLYKYVGEGKVSMEFYQACIDYQNAYESRIQAENTLAIDEATAEANKRALGTQMVLNIEQENKNKQTEIDNNRADIEYSLNMKKARGVDLDESDYESLIANSQEEEANKYATAEAIRQLAAANVAAGIWTEADLEYIDAMNSAQEYEDQGHQCAVSQEEWNNAIINLPVQRLEEAISVLDSAKKALESLQKVQTTIGFKLDNLDYLDLIDSTTEELAKQASITAEKENGLAAARASSDGSYGGKDIDTWLKEYNESKAKENEYTATIQEYKNKQIQLPLDQIDEALSMLDKLISKLQSLIKLKLAKGLDLLESDYTSEMSYNNSLISEKENRLDELNNQLKEAKKAGGAYGGKTLQEIEEEILATETEIYDLETANEELKKSLRDDVYWRDFNRMIESLERTKSLLSSIKTFFSDDMFWDNDGKMTKYAIAQIGLLAKEYLKSTESVAEYQDQIKLLNEERANGKWADEEYKAELQELQEGLLGAGLAAQDAAKEIINMYEQAAQKEIDNLKKVITYRQEALKAKKDYYDYNKSINSKNKDIQSIQMQIAALQGVTTAEAKAKMAKLTEELLDALDELDDMILEHEIELSDKALEEFGEKLQEAHDEEWQTIMQDTTRIKEVLQTGLNLSDEAAEKIAETIGETLGQWGVDIGSSGIGNKVELEGYASGSRYIDKNKLAWTQENGAEMIVRKSDGAILTPLSLGDGVIPADLTANLYKFAQAVPNLLQNSFEVPSVSPAVSVVNNYDSLIRVDGNVDSTVVSDLQEFAQQFYKGSYDYTVKAITRDAKKMGLRV